jgi:hypothetical protein
MFRASFLPIIMEFSTVHSTLVSFVQVYDDRFQAESGWNCSSILTPCPKHVEFYDRINWKNCASGWLFKKKSITMHGDMNVKYNNMQ